MNQPIRIICSATLCAIIRLSWCLWFVPCARCSAKEKESKDILVFC